MTLTVEMMTFDALDAPALAQWWAAQTGGVVQDPADTPFVVVAPGPEGGPALGFQQVAAPTRGKNRVHLDLTTPDRVAEVARLIGVGAKFVAEHRENGLAWTVLADPEGNQFCVSAPPA
ncbi:VOC family protein [Cellulomonas cellasea]|uniref:VOC family protein n=1 Tax=Cellulomonas cellasea TaxID=43670 RepID=UPI0025A3FADC|nr:VOC family protein [Cellulomonas cellasea]MDM8084142.1 VOC family protein [Cellulomonas cellasea]